MPAQYWAFAFVISMGLFVLPFTWAMLARDVRWLAALADLPHARGLDDGDGAVFHGRLTGDGRNTPLGARTAGWVGRVIVSRRSGKSNVVSEKCRLAALDGLVLETEGGRAPIAPPRTYALDADVSLGDSDRVPRWWLGERLEVSPIPPDVVARCRLARSDLASDRWSYVEDRAALGAPVEVAGCLRGGVITGCSSGPAAGHLAVGGMPALILRMTDHTMLTSALVSMVMCFFTFVAGIGAVVALRGAAIRSGGVL